MDPQRWQRITELFHEALAKDALLREGFLAGACGSDAELRRDVDAMLAADANAASSPEPFRTPTPSLTLGTLFGPYRIESLIGAGGMGEVYRARDTRLNRSVAIKVLPAAFANEPELRQRFEREAQAIAALDHPHICVLHDVGYQDGHPFLVMEHLTGDTLQDRLARGPLPLEQVLRYAIEIADALHDAHRAGILHRDLKPGNIMITKDGAKLLDFGLAKFGGGSRVHDRATATPTTPRTITTEGTIVGTFQYMAPELLEGKDADERTDLFAFGDVLYEMAAGRPPFTGESRSSLIASILRDEPPPLTASAATVPAALDLLIRACLAKDPDARLQSARDVALQLRWIQAGAFAPAAAVGGTGGRRVAWAAAAALAVATVIAVGGYLAGRGARPDRLKLTQLTFRHGYVPAARLTPDGQTVLYRSEREGQPAASYSMRLDTREDQALPAAYGTVASVSKAGELAVLDDGKLGLVPLGGSGVRQSLDRVCCADWAPDGKSMAVLRQLQPTGLALEYPIGTVLQEWKGSTRPIEGVRVSRDGETVALTEMDETGGGWLVMIDRSGKAKRMTSRFPSVAPGLAWSPSDAEVWFNASEVGLNFNVYAVTRTGRVRLLHQTMGSERVQDVGADGRAIIAHDRVRAVLMGLAPGQQRERDLSWWDLSMPQNLSADGRFVSIDESGVGAGTKTVAFLRGTDGSPAIRFGEGNMGPLSPDGKYLLFGEGNRNVLKQLPVGAGEGRTIVTGTLTDILGHGAWLADGRRAVIYAREPGRPARLYLVSIDGSAPRPITPEAVDWPRSLIVVSPDSRYVIARDLRKQGSLWMYPIEGGEPIALKGAERGEIPLRWHPNGRSIWLLGRERWPARIYQLDVATGRRTFWREVAADIDRGGLNPDQFRLMISADGRSYVYSYVRSVSDLYLVEGLKTMR